MYMLAIAQRERDELDLVHTFETRYGPGMETAKIFNKSQSGR